MAYVTALLPMRQGCRCTPRSRRAADTTCDGRGRGQVMADTFVERVTGRPADVAEPVAVNLVITDETLLGGDDTAGRGERIRADPGAVARGLVHEAVTDERSRCTLRRLYRHPEVGSVGGDGVAVAALPQRVGDVHRRCATNLPHPVLRCADPTSRPRPTPTPRRTDKRRERVGRVRTLQLRQRSAGLAGHRGNNESGVHTAEFITPTGARYRSTRAAATGLARRRDDEAGSQDRHRDRRDTPPSVGRRIHRRPGRRRLRRREAPTCRGSSASRRRGSAVPWSASRSRPSPCR